MKKNKSSKGKHKANLQKVVHKRHSSVGHQSDAATDTKQTKEESPRPPRLTHSTTVVLPPHNIERGRSCQRISNSCSNSFEEEPSLPKAETEYSPEREPLAEWKDVIPEPGVPVSLLNHTDNTPEACNVKVMCRVRPLNQMERQHQDLCVDFAGKTGISVTTESGTRTDVHKFNFDHVFNMNATQAQVYDIAAKQVIQSVLEGFNGTIFAYGQTASGKTYTMQGELEAEETMGIIPRIITTLFEYIETANENMVFTVKVSMVEIYKEKIKDLLNQTGINLKIHQDKTRGIFIEGAREMYIGEEDDIYAIMEEGNENRAMAETEMNSQSSRSHSIFMMNISCNDQVCTKVGKLYVVDLAGSEKVEKSGATGETLEEAKMINKSLTMLGMVINALTDGKSTHIPYRDSKLTRILQESLGGNAKTSLIITCSPSVYNAPETLSTCRFGMRAKRITNKAMINKEFTIDELKNIIKKLEYEIFQKDRYIKMMEDLAAQNGGMSILSGISGISGGDVGLSLEAEFGEHIDTTSTMEAVEQQRNANFFAGAKYYSNPGPTLGTVSVATNTEIAAGTGGEMTTYEDNTNIHSMGRSSAIPEATEEEENSDCSDKKQNTSSYGGYKIEAVRSKMEFDETSRELEETKEQVETLLSRLVQERGRVKVLEKKSKEMCVELRLVQAEMNAKVNKLQDNLDHTANEKAKEIDKLVKEKRLLEKKTEVLKMQNREYFSNLNSQKIEMENITKNLRQSEGHIGEVIGMMGNMGNMGNMDIIPKIQDLLQKAFVFAKLGLREEPGLGEKTNKPPLAKNRARTKERAERTPPGAKAGSEIIISLGINEERGRSQGGHRGTGSTTNPTFRNPVLAPGSQGDDIENIPEKEKERPEYLRRDRDYYRQCVEQQVAEIRELKEILKKYRRILSTGEGKMGQEIEVLQEQIKHVSQLHANLQKENGSLKRNMRYYEKKLKSINDKLKEKDGLYQEKLKEIEKFNQEAEQIRNVFSSQQTYEKKMIFPKSAKPIRGGSTEDVNRNLTSDIARRASDFKGLLMPGFYSSPKTAPVSPKSRSLIPQHMMNNRFHEY